MSATRIEVPRPQRIPLGGVSAVVSHNSSTRLEIPRAANAGARLEPRAALEPRVALEPRIALEQGAAFDPRASAALPLLKRVAGRVEAKVIDTAESTTKLSYTAESSTTMWIRETRALPLVRPLDRICILMTQALPLVRINHSERLERRAVAERVAIVVVFAMAVVMTMLAIASAITRFVG